VKPFALRLFGTTSANKLESAGTLIPYKRILRIGVRIIPAFSVLHSHIQIFDAPFGINSFQKGCYYCGYKRRVRSKSDLYLAVPLMPPHGRHRTDSAPGLDHLAER